MDNFLTYLYRHYFNAETSITEALDDQKQPMASVGSTTGILETLKAAKVDDGVISDIESQVDRIINEGNGYQNDIKRLVVKYREADLDFIRHLIAEYMQDNYQRRQ